jgi:dienelactone hydrolase
MEAMEPVARIEAISLASRTLGDAAFLAGQPGERATIAGVLRIPGARGGPRPVVILLHGSGGPIAYVDAWALRLHALGWATFLVDSFSGRGLASVRDNQRALGRLVGVLDAYQALQALAQHPLVDPGRIVLMGFSRGGQCALYAAMRRFQRMHLRGGARFAGHIAFYPNCCTRYLEDEDLAPVPVRIHHGEADDFNPIAPCRAYVQRLQAAGHDVQLMAYPGAHHVFDWHGFVQPVVAPQAQSMRACRVVEAAPGVLLNELTGKLFSYSDPCVARGTTAAYHPRAAQAAIAAVAEWLGRLSR